MEKFQKYFGWIQYHFYLVDEHIYLNLSKYEDAWAIFVRLSFLYKKEWIYWWPKSMGKSKLSTTDW